MKGTITPVTLIRHEPIGTSTGLAFVDWRDDSAPYGMSGGVREVTSPVYARSDDADRFRRWRVDQRITASEVAKAAALGIVDAFGLERGECSPACGWDALRGIVLRWRDGGALLAAVIANGGTLPTVGPVPSVADIIAERWDEDEES